MGIAISRGVLAATVATALASVSPLGCDGSESEPANDDGDLRQEYCEAAITRDERCGREPPTMDRCMYDEDSQCFFDLVRPELFAGVVACLDALPCGEQAILCVYEVGTAEPTAGQEAYRTACEAREDECQSFGDYCEASFMKSAIYEAMEDCLPLACDQVSPCLQAARPASCQ